MILRAKFRHFVPVLVAISQFLLTPNLPPAAGQSTGGQATTQVFIPLVFGLPPAHQGTLDNGGVVSGPDGISIGAPAGSLTSPVEVALASTNPPTVTLPAPAQALGTYVHISAAAPTYVSPQNPLVLAFPVPQGADAAHLALAVLQPFEQFHDVEATRPYWGFLEGLYDPAQELFLTTSAALTSKGETYVLVEYPGYDSPSTAAAAAGSIDRPSSAYTVQCVNFTNTIDCISTTESLAAALLVGFENHLQGDLGFAPPHLRNSLQIISFVPPSVTVTGYKAYIESRTFGYCAKAGVGGYYTPEQARLVLCLNPAVGLNGDYVQILLHEYFHATQYGYDAVMQDYTAGKQILWVLDGMAKTTEESFYVNRMMRSLVGNWVELFKVDTPLEGNTGSEPYFSQDFWVYYGQLYGHDLSYLKNVLSRGMEIRDVAAALGSGDYLEPYWPWAKNQAIEATKTLDGALKTPCELETNLVKLPSVFTYKFGDPDFITHDVTVTPLTTVVVEVQFDHNYDVSAGVVFPTNPDLGGRDIMALEYKFCVEGESGCDQVPEGPRIYQSVTVSDVYYVLIANKDIANTWDYIVAFEVHPPPPSWATPAPVITNFTDFTYYTSLSLPKGVKVEGHTLYNPGTGVVNPRLDQGAVPLRFSTDPATLFLPSVEKGP
jgi:hypothetical protein